MFFDQAMILILHAEILTPIIIFLLKYTGLFQDAGFKSMWLLGPELTSDGEDKCVEEPEYNCTKRWQEQQSVVHFQSLDENE